MKPTKRRCGWWTGERTIKTLVVKGDGPHVHTDSDGNVTCHGPLRGGK